MNNNILLEIRDKLLQEISKQIDNITAIYDHLPVSPNLPYIHVAEYQIENNVLINNKVIYIILDFNIKTYYVANVFSACDKLINYLIQLNDVTFNINKYKILSVNILKINHINKDNTTKSLIKTRLSLIKI